MPDATILREPTEEEKKEFIDVRDPLHKQNTPQAQFLLALREKEYEYTKKYLPFDYQCARLDFLDKLDRAKKEATRGGRTEREIKIDFGDLDSYGNPKRFFLVKEDEDIEMRTIDNIKTPIIVSVSRQFRCSERGHKTTICIPRSIYEERKKK